MLHTRMITLALLHLELSPLLVFEFDFVSTYKNDNSGGEITPKVRKPKLSFFYVTCRFFLFNISVKYHKKILKVIQLTEWTMHNQCQI